MKTCTIVKPHGWEEVYCEDEETEDKELANILCSRGM